jgi:GTP-binding protein HflX
VVLPNGWAILVTDTVGFLQRLPHGLVAAFRATLEEVSAADLLLHVIDASNPERDRQEAAVRSVLSEVDAANVPSVDVFNKCDRLDAAERARIRALHPGALCVSATTGEGRDDLIAAMEARLALDTARVTLELDASDGERIAQLYRVGRVLRHVSSDGRVSIDAEIPRRVLDRFPSAVLQ